MGERRDEAARRPGAGEQRGGGTEGSRLGFFLLGIGGVGAWIFLTVLPYGVGCASEVSPFPLG